ncbi:hypothetical protein FNJ88_04000 [Chryseobacterium sp. SNU WT5]|uniref:hypothetical protein n=1 Tax=Chryseobacterium sp. SNU WT5 TaxID=2594269 RepID=UPI001180C5E7|nr:hypothetical protein [Chryseobacterium sp. SNU WT5]QDP84752.1 hypothetical protein FNJ88_04000 [Chryseobacterium sp. SNU WT5]
MKKINKNLGIPYAIGYILAGLVILPLLIFGVNKLFFQGNDVEKYIYAYIEDSEEIKIAENDYGKIATNPIEKGAEVSVIVNNRSTEATNRLNDFEKKKIDQFKQENSAHKYGKGKKSKHYGRQQQRQQKLNTKARRIAAQDRSRLSQRYKGRVENTAKRNFTRANYGVIFPKNKNI